MTNSKIFLKKILDRTYFSTEWHSFIVGLIWFFISFIALYLLTGTLSIIGLAAMLGCSAYLLDMIRDIFPVAVFVLFLALLVLLFYYSTGKDTVNQYEQI